VKISRKIWGGFVFALGLLWLVGGALGYFQGNWKMLLMVFCGIVLVRMGFNLMRGDRDP
jgi:uncharacterized membrane protein (UPF0136 family)